MPLEFHLVIYNVHRTRYTCSRREGSRPLLLHFHAAYVEVLEIEQALYVIATRKLVVSDHFYDNLVRQLAAITLIVEHDSPESCLHRHVFEPHYS